MVLSRHTNSVESFHDQLKSDTFLEAELMFVVEGWSFTSFMKIHFDTRRSCSVLPLIYQVIVQCLIVARRIQLLIFFLRLLQDGGRLRFLAEREKSCLNRSKIVWIKTVLCSSLNLHCRNVNLSNYPF